MSISRAKRANVNSFLIWNLGWTFDNSMKTFSLQTLFNRDISQLEFQNGNPFKLTLGRFSRETFNTICLTSKNRPLLSLTKASPSLYGLKRSNGPIIDYVCWNLYIFKMTVYSKRPLIQKQPLKPLKRRYFRSFRYKMTTEHLLFLILTDSKVFLYKELLQSQTWFKVISQPLIRNTISLNSKQLWSTYLPSAYPLTLYIYLTITRDIPT